MEQTDRDSRPASPDIPKLPIKTYRWEDVRRSRRRGAYPWTHLTKPPYDEDVDPEEYTMDAFRRSRSTSTLGKSETHEITDIEEEFETDKMDEGDNQQIENKENENTENVQSSTSKTEFDTIPIIPSNGSKDRAKSEEPVKKRKLSVDSSYSRISLPRLRLMEKLKNAKSKLRVPKLPKRSRSNVSDTKEVKKPKVATSTDKQKPLNNNSPVYIHIPLKPPLGETDEFSKYEFESPSHSPVGSLTNIEIPKKRRTSLLQMLTQIKNVHDQHVARRSSQPTDEIKKTVKLKPDSDDQVVRIQEITTEEQSSTKEYDQEPTVEIEESGSTSHTELQESLKSDKVTIEEVIDEENTLDNNAEKRKTPEPVKMDIECSSVDDNISQCLDKDEQYEEIAEVKQTTLVDTPHPSTTKQESEFKPDPEKLRKLEGALSKWKKTVPKTPHFELPPAESLPIRAHSEEPKRKRKSSIDSSYSRKSLSKLAFLKKIKQAKEKIKFPKFPSFSKFDKKNVAKVKEKKVEPQKPTENLKKTFQPDKPVYIHIPLKPPPGLTDEFSYLENDHKPESVPEPQTPDENKEPETPESDSERNVQLIILTPPSDDEILDSASETPSETDKKFFENLKIDDLKTLAKNAVNTVYPEAKTLETVEEDENSDVEEVTEESVEESALPEPRKHQILVDEEDGLKLSEAAIAMINEELEKEYKQQAMGLKSIIKTETSPVLKKKVSFRRKSKQDGGERIYEDVQLNKSQSKTEPEESVVAHSVVIPLESFQSMSVDEEKSYLDKQLMKNTSLEDDYNKWSTSNDHEYEPVNPPPEVITIQNPPIIHDNNLPLKEEVQTSFKEERSNREDEENAKSLNVEETQKYIEDRFFNQSAETSKPTDKKGSSTMQKQSSKEESPKAKVKTKSRTGNNINEAIKTHADKLKTKLRNIKRPNITLPQRPKFPTAKLRKPNFKKPNIKMPKMPDRPKINMPSFNFARKKDTWRERQLSTESNAGDSKIKIFDFRTYPRMFDRSKKKEEQESSTLPPEFATMPRTSKTKTTQSSRWTASQEIVKKNQPSPNVIRIPLHPEEEDKESIDIPQEIEMEDENETEFRQEEKDGSLFSKDFLKRWEHGKFHEDGHIPIEGYNTDEYRNNEAEDVQIPGEDSFEITPPKEHSSGSLSEHRRGVLEEIDSDEFFLREKGISQEDIEVGKYLSSEIREAFRNPATQFQSEDREYDMELSDQSEPIREAPRRKPLRKPKRKKTPHVSREQISFDRESYNTEPEEDLRTSEEPIEVTPPVRPKRRSTRKKKKSLSADVIPYQETIPIEDQTEMFIHPDYTSDLIENSDILPDNILNNDMQLHYDNEYRQFYENEHMKGIEQPEITVSHTYYQFQPYFDDRPPIPPIRRRRSRSLRSLSVSDQGSILEEDKLSKDTSAEHFSAFAPDHEYIIPTPEPPIRPRRTRSRTRSQSVLQQEEVAPEEENELSQRFTEEELFRYTSEEVVAPRYAPEEELSRYALEDVAPSRYAPEEDEVEEEVFVVSTTPIAQEVEVQEIIEAPCTQDIRDASGYAVIDKSRVREPPLPSSRFDDAPKTPPRRRRKKKNKTDDKFATVPRLPKSESGPPMRPLRNYSTLRGTNSTLTDEEKENLNTSAGRLQSGEVIQKMRDRPLPAPPRPPRRSRSALSDISHKQNVLTESQQDNMDKLEQDILMDIEDQIEQYDHEETITHGALVLQTVVDPNIVPYAQVSKPNNTDQKVPTERIVPITQEIDEEVKQQVEERSENENEEDDFSVIPDEFKNLKSPEEQFAEEEPDKDVSTVPEEFTNLKTLADIVSKEPEEFHKLQDPPIMNEEKFQSSLFDGQEVSVLKAQKLQVCDLDVDKLRVRELQASKIIVSELDGVSLQVSEINSKCGNLVVSGIDLPPNLIQEMLQKLQLAVSEQASSEAPPPEVQQTIRDEDEGQKKTSIEELEEQVPPVPPRYDSRTNLLDEEIMPLSTNEAQNQPPEELLQPPIRPPRRSSQVDKLGISTEQTPERESSSNVEDVANESDVLKKTSNLSDSDSGLNREDFVKFEDEPPPIPPKQRVKAELEPSQASSKSYNELPPRPPEPIFTDDSSHQRRLETLVDDGLPSLPAPLDPLVDDELISPPRPPEPLIDDYPPRPPEPFIDDLNYTPSQPPPSFFTLKSPHLKEFFDEDIPLPPRRKRHHRPPPVSRSSSEDVALAPRRHHRSSEQSIPQLTGQLVRLCAAESERSIKRLISHITNNVLQNADGKQDLHVIILLLLILIAGILLLSEPKVTVLENHWDFFNPPADM